MKNLSKVSVILLVIFGMFSCGGKQQGIIPERPVIDPSPTEVVQDFLKALKNEDFERAFKYIYAPYSDKVAYVTQMKNTVEKNQASIVSYQILGTQIYDRTSIVVAELTTKRKSRKTGSIVEQTQRTQYNLGLFEDAWKITNDTCIENCVEEEPEIEITE